LEIVGDQALVMTEKRRFANPKKVPLYVTFLILFGIYICPKGMYQRSEFILGYQFITKKLTKPFSSPLGDSKWFVMDS
jgi:hypothetical protein